MDYLEFVRECADPETLVLRTAEFLQQQEIKRQFVLIKHRPSLNPFTLLLCQNDAFDFEPWKKSLLNKTIAVQPGRTVFFQDWYYFFPEAHYKTEPFFFFLFSEKPDTFLQNLLLQWNHCAALLNASAVQIAAEYEMAQGSLVSQLLHDVNTIISLQEPEEVAQDFKLRIAYQKKANEDLLFYMRPLELLPFGVAVDQLIASSLQLCEIDNNNFLLTISSELADISIDVELFSKAFNEIIWNAYQATNNNASKIRIEVNRIPSGSPFINHDWLEIMIVDKGIGISKDYLGHIWEPFFTTRKAAGHTGFGLTNAKKIVTALNGYLELTSKKGHGTEVKMYLPYL